ncbi:tRNA dimethylallyltransferase [Roseivirga spongicola]|uniref:tRNA dimethylallyltransferase n=1 Tax=Roseivirga spongicola TaxID=333140 RepID=A0A150WZG7_9BACT|nr:MULTISPECIES: tRNA (adenosine(37)-N6)-dimethylallyltransferase MiaA [Roseivirga]KYG71816.1 tRNA dimethylallyltransferase [Roseivirga spongicola]MBO6662207.1 tRNA (adenosine(37)-N6)-dimethylallyltransferase MiaA [Roseivirga sp.]MBO6761781.1 tRNA (adenosine(37)-N6)-dimethylallyltransferase MiaA [Roseivirga sp.]MBO6910065.1 tRNA (adenosine(37)-N6)-dimethylallyltransferase MiaA [Roseivirga sp.]
METLKKYLTCIVGPTAVGKTSTAIKVAQFLNTEIISADSRQFYKELEIGTAKPDALELSEAKHHLVNSLSIHDEYDVGQFEGDALAIINQVHERNNSVVMVGGSGLFIDAVCNGLDEFPEIEDGLRDTLNDEFKQNGLQRLVDELEGKDPEYWSIVDRKNPQRIIRALEVIRSTGKKFSDFRKRSKKERPFEVIKIGLTMEREQLYGRIDRRMDIMIEQGLFEEAKQFIPYKSLNALQTVGYQEIFPYLEGDYDYAEAVRLLKRNSRRYAKRQLTWFRKDESVEWFEPSKTEQILDYIDQKIRKA